MSIKSTLTYLIFPALFFIEPLIVNHNVPAAVTDHERALDGY